MCVPVSLVFERQHMYKILKPQFLYNIVGPELSLYSEPRSHQPVYFLPFVNSHGWVSLRNIFF